jgi:16S rRNA (cytosine1402-N4)-methyltransferase
VPQEHEPVLAEELIDVLDPRPGETFVDCTFGGGGHARLIAERIGPAGELIAVDRDPTSEARWSEFAADVPSRARFLRADFVAALEGLRGEGLRPDGIVFDLGMSSMQLDAWERGFSLRLRRPARHADGSDSEPVCSHRGQRVAPRPPRQGARKLGEERRPDRSRARSRGAGRWRPPPSSSPRSRRRSRPPSVSAAVIRRSAHSRRSGSR